MKQWFLRGLTVVLFIGAVAMIVYGAIGGEAVETMFNGSMICLSCIGIG